MSEWEQDCLRWRGRVLTGKYTHWCQGWDDLPIDETTPEWPCECAEELKGKNMKEFEVTREIGIDAGHRVTYHHSKCRSLHGHRYTIQATCRGPLEEEGSGEGMTIDFGFLKEEMMAEIDAPCDHALILWQSDPLITLFSPTALSPIQIEGAFEAEGFGGKLYIVGFVPTAENLARHWYARLAPKILKRTEGRSRLHRIRVYETPNCWADYEEGATS